MTRIPLPFASLLILIGMFACGTPQATRLQPVVARPVAPEISMKYNFYEANDSLHFYMRFEDEQEVLDVLQSTTSVEYFVKTGLSDRDKVLAADSLVKPARKITDIEGQLHMSFTIPASIIAEPNILHIRIWQALVGQERMAIRYRIPLKAQMLEKSYLLVKVKDEKPIFGDYLNTSDKIFIRQYDSQTQPLTVHYFEGDLAPALPPMSAQQRATAPAMPVADTLAFSAGDTVGFERDGFYLFEPSSTFAKGILVQKWAYPQLSMAQELLQPLIYITTSAERESLMNATDAKEAIDNFWLKVAGDKATARELIRSYYGRVEKANTLFTCHKPGWATDRGMIYIIYGKPNTISRTGNTETWIYRESEVSPYVKFVFNKKENNFTKNYYELIRHREYEESWYSTVAKWRAGITDNM
ncbi:GWxTD domain-containing protein [uncultured Pontibacter sp.]|uniref:GWxTD domain-containing protein n=1 Tax=uncultured Pontibacter sp. TaxID=453356 RepID=UPI002605DF9F|nr:GWxTD domain-containing protein [uncultured Pontibacter sp.]